MPGREAEGPGVSDTVPGHRFVVLTMPRSGSTWFLDALGHLPGVTTYTELFLPRRKPRSARLMSSGTAEYLDARLRGVPLFCEVEGTGCRRPRAVVSYLDEIYRRPGAVGFKVMYGNLPRYPELWAYFIARRVRIVHLVRRSLLDVVISEEVRSVTGMVHRLGGEPDVAIEPIELEPTDVVRRIRRMRARVRMTRFVLRATRLAHLEIAYEDLTSQPPAFETVCGFLEVDCGGQPPRSRLAKRVQRPRAEMVRNYAEVLNALEAAGLRGPSP